MQARCCSFVEVGAAHFPKLTGANPCCVFLQDLLSGQFNVTLGDKLSEHLKKWIDVTNVLQPPQPVKPILCWSWPPPGSTWVRILSSVVVLAMSCCDVTAASN